MGQPSACGSDDAPIAGRGSNDGLIAGRGSNDGLIAGRRGTAAIVIAAAGAVPLKSYAIVDLKARRGLLKGSDEVPPCRSSGFARECPHQCVQLHRI
jgi:hypothetical protein